MSQLSNSQYDIYASVTHIVCAQNGTQDRTMYVCSCIGSSKNFAQYFLFQTMPKPNLFGYLQILQRTFNILGENSRCNGRRIIAVQLHLHRQRE